MYGRDAQHNKMHSGLIEEHFFCDSSGEKTEEGAKAERQQTFLLHLMSPPRDYWNKRFDYDDDKAKARTM
jgi:hypothetical protein